MRLGCADTVADITRVTSRVFEFRRLDVQTFAIIPQPYPFGRLYDRSVSEPHRFRQRTVSTEYKQYYNDTFSNDKTRIKIVRLYRVSHEDVRASDVSRVEKYLLC